MSSTVVLDCGQKCQRFLYFRDDPAKDDGRPARVTVTTGQREQNIGPKHEEAGVNQPLMSSIDCPVNSSIVVPEAEARVLRQCARFGRGGCEVVSFSGQQCAALATFIGNRLVGAEHRVESSLNILAMPGIGMD